MAYITTYGGFVTFGGQSTVACKSVSVSWERESLDVTRVEDWYQRKAPGRFRRFGTMTLYRQDLTVDDNLRAHIEPLSLANAVNATLSFKYVDQGGKSYDAIGAGTGNMAIQITSCSFTDDGTGIGTWELSWEEQAPVV